MLSSDPAYGIVSYNIAGGHEQVHSTKHMTDWRVTKKKVTNNCMSRNTFCYVADESCLLTIPACASHTAVRARAPSATSSTLIVTHLISPNTAVVRSLLALVE